MLRIGNARQLQGRAIGAMIMTGFGALWLLLALYAEQTLSAANAAYVAAAALAMACGAMYLYRLAARWPLTPRNPALGRAFGWIFAWESIAIFAAWTLLGPLHLSVYGISATVGIVGLHFIPLARLFRYAPHYVTGALMTLWAAYSAVRVPAERMQDVAALGAGVILLASAAFTLALAVFAINRSLRYTVRSEAV
ncbi:MAG: hypothetical protein ACRD3N_00780 [Terracidiphilus sp.]